MSRGIFSCHNHREGPLLVSSGQESRILISTLQRPGPHKKKKKKYEAQRSVSWGSLPSAIGSWTADWNVQTAMKCLFEETAFKTFREGYSGAWLMYSSESMLLPLFPFAWNVKGHYKKTGHSVYQKVFSLIFFFKLLFFISSLGNHGCNELHFQPHWLHEVIKVWCFSHL